ncbi:LysR family transcriptional regulator [Poseidonocella sp. HB161398]|uniref:LysR family transcriptional regulator n=1 Tax=Poseidonocella sp. HB161398 TaxID=2320855 RepID=UPI0011098989|nr:LysR family transcriptional regulator [Poseidonocella sp. HB161398]
MDLNALKEFSAVIEQGSFAAAARKLNTPKSTVSKRIQDLERDLGVKLIERTTRRLRLTAEGALVLARAERILADAEDIARSLGDSDGRVRGHLRIAAPLLFGQTYLGPLAAECRRRHPEMTLELVLTDGQPDLDEEGFDAAIRLGSGTGAQVTRPLFQSTRILVSAPGILGTPPVSPRQLADYPVALYGIGLIQSWHLTDGREDMIVRVAGGMSFSSYPCLYSAVMSGAGLALLPEYLVADDIATGRLVRHLPQWSSLPVELSLVYPGARSLTHRLRAFIDLLQELFPAPMGA